MARFQADGAIGTLAGPPGARELASRMVRFDVTPSGTVWQTDTMTSGRIIIGRRADT
jgi:hypothetical protein